MLCLKAEQFAAWTVKMMDLEFGQPIFYDLSLSEIPATPP